MIVAFDLDDTLYRELDYVESGFRAVASHLEAEFGIPRQEAFLEMIRSLEAHGRGRQFDDVLHAHGLFTVARRDQLVQVYRRHDPELTLPEASKKALAQCASLGHRLFLVTDGNHRVQAKKIEALDLWRRFDHCYLTNRYGRSAAKPSTRVFELMLARVRSGPDQLVYVGDNPSKDFVGVRKLGGATIRVRRGHFADTVAQPGFDADVSIDAIDEVTDAIGGIAVQRSKAHADLEAEPTEV